MIDSLSIIKRRCIRCKEEKYLTEFYPNKGQPLGTRYECKSCSKELSVKRRKTDPAYAERQRLCRKRCQDNLKRLVMTHYGRGKATCVICGESDLRCLSIDHINGGGIQHRRELGGQAGKGGNNFYNWLKRNSFPLGYQTLCMNCQFKRRDERHENV